MSHRACQICNHKLQRLNFYRFNWVTISIDTNSSDSFSQGWIFQPLKQRGWGPIYRETPPPKSRQALTWVLGLDLGFGPFNQALP